MAQPKFCRDCIYSKPEETATWNLRCTHPRVAIDDEWNLSSAKINGTDCRVERGKPWFVLPACGKAGKLYDKF